MPDLSFDIIYECPECGLTTQVEEDYCLEVVDRGEGPQACGRLVHVVVRLEGVKP